VQRIDRSGTGANAATSDRARHLRTALSASAGCDTSARWQTKTLFILSIIAPIIYVAYFIIGWYNEYYDNETGGATTLTGDMDKSFR
jgi:hypothetical protein